MRRWLAARSRASCRPKSSRRSRPSGASTRARGGELVATHAIDSTAVNAVAEIRKITRSGADYAMEASGRPEVVRQALDCLAITGVCGVIGGAPPGTEITLDVNRILLGRTVRGILGGDSIPDIFIPKLIDLYVSGRFPVDRLITFYSLEEINQAAADSLSGIAIKPVLRTGLAELVGESPAIMSVRDSLGRLLGRLRPGQRLPSILIQGETGTA